MTLYLVRHGRSMPRPGVPAAEWDLDPEGYDAVRALRDSGRLPARAAWVSSPEPKALGTARLLTDVPVSVDEGLREHRRDNTDWLDDFAGTVARAFAEPGVAAHEGWEPLDRCRERVGSAARRLLETHADGDLVLVGHGTAWTVLVAQLTRRPPDLDRWRDLAMPDLIVVEPAQP